VLLNVVLQEVAEGTTATSREVRRRPEHAFPIACCQVRSPQWREEVNALAAISLGGRGGELIEDGVRELFGVGLPADVPRGIDTIAVGL